MRLTTLFAALALIAAPIAAAPGIAQADGIERPHRPAPRPRPHRHVRPPAPVRLVPPPIEHRAERETVTLSQAFFAGSAGGVGTDIGTGYVGGGTTYISAGGGAVAFAFASASASARAGGHFGGHSGGGHRGGGCGCH